MNGDEFVYADMTHRSEVTVGRGDFGWVTRKRDGRTLGSVMRVEGGWEGWHAMGMRRFDTRREAVYYILEFANMAARSQAYSTMCGRMSLAGTHRASEAVSA